MNKRQKKKNTRKINKALIKEYPFLRPLDYYTSEPIKNINYNFTLLDDMPIGWKKAFGKLLCEDLKEALVKTNSLEEYSVCQVKEKFGSLRWYDNGHTNEVGDTLAKYEYISQFICVECGKINVPTINEGWVMPMCEGCYNRNASRKRKYGITSNYGKAIIHNEQIQSTFEVKRYINGKNELIKYDCSDILKRMNYK